MARFTDTLSSTYAAGGLSGDICNITKYTGAGKRNSAELTTPGCCAWVAPVTATATFEVWGGGGSGAARCCCDCGHDGHNGSGGGYATVTADIVAGQVYTVCVGCGGFQSISTAGHWCCIGQSGQTSFVTGPSLVGVTLCATGGGPGNNSCLTGGTGQPGGCGVVTGASNTVSFAANTSSSGWTSYNTPCYCWQQRSMMGASQGTNNQANINSDWWYKNNVDGASNGGFTTGIYPAGGGATPKNFQGCGCRQGGVGANGLVRIKW